MTLSARLPSRILVTGCASGIGEAGARILAEADCKLVLLDNQETKLLRLARDLDAIALPVDVADHLALADAVGLAIEAFGGLDAVWSNAGIQQGGDVEEAAIEDFDYSYMVNVRAHFIVAKHAIPELRRNGGGVFLITASNSGLQPETALVPYAVSKGATIALARQLALDHAGDRIRVNALCPGYVDTPFNAAIWHPFGGREGFLERVAEYVPLGRMADATEVAKVACWLLSDASAYMTGANVVVDGGELIG